VAAARNNRTREFLQQVAAFYQSNKSQMGSVLVVNPNPRVLDCPNENGNRREAAWEAVVFDTALAMKPVHVV
jgi:hypothetical protein